MDSFLSCDLDLCIYNNERKCALKNIAINGDGCCSQILFSNIPDEKLTIYKEKTLLSLKRD